MSLRGCRCPLESHNSSTRKGKAQNSPRAFPIALRALVQVRLPVQPEWIRDHSTAKSPNIRPSYSAMSASRQRGVHSGAVQG
uniref:Uncharacterized protein n=1 Tax=Anguilla anguilla TaxID=7936 RepID=A0A0E9XMJ1_ANGAN